MTERVVRMNLRSGDLRIVALDDAVSELAAEGLYSEIAPKLRGGEAFRLPTGVAFRALSTLGEHGIDRLPPEAIN